MLLIHTPSSLPFAPKTFIAKPLLEPFWSKTDCSVLAVLFDSHLSFPLFYLFFVTFWFLSWVYLAFSRSSIFSNFSANGHFRMVSNFVVPVYCFLSLGMIIFLNLFQLGPFHHEKNLIGVGLLFFPLPRRLVDYHIFTLTPLGWVWTALPPTSQSGELNGKWDGPFHPLSPLEMRRGALAHALQIRKFFSFPKPLRSLSQNR